MGTKDKTFEWEILPYVSLEIRSLLRSMDEKVLKTLEEVRVRANQPIMVQNSAGDWFVTKNGRMWKETVDPCFIKQDEIIKSMELMSQSSIYAYLDEIKNGYITLKGGHRVGITGKVVMEGNNIKNIKDVSGLNIRISKEILDCALPVMRYILKNSETVYNTLIVSPPACGKTTLLRDITRLTSDGMSQYGFRGLKVGLVDERSEIAACFKGVAQHHMGVRTDVLDSCPKSLGMTLILRSMSPQVIITDEIGNQGDKEAILRILNGGAKIITTAHGYNVSELKSRREVLGLIKEKAFERFIVLSKAEGPGTLEEVINGEDMKVIYRRVPNDH